MSHRPAPQLSFCRVGDRLIFLNVAEDRYFCLSRAAESAFVEATEQGRGEGLPNALRVGGFVASQSAGRVPVECVAPPLPERSLLDQPLPAIATARAVKALCDLTAARARLRLFGLRRALGSLSCRKATLSCPVGLGDAGELQATMAEFAAANGILSSLDNCLSQSLAVAARLLKRSVPVDLVIGVRLGPFNAHCWVQRGDWLVNDRIDMVRMFTPILVI